jgi:hypothetical protein
VRAVSCLALDLSSSVTPEVCLVSVPRGFSESQYAMHRLAKLVSLKQNPSAFPSGKAFGF